MQATFSTTFILRSSRMRNGLTPIYCRVTVDGQRAEFSIKKSVAENAWAIGKVKGNSENISYESFRMKYYNVENGTKDSLKNVLHNAIGYINNN